jgi:hypothetical protein
MSAETFWIVVHLNGSEVQQKANTEVVHNEVSCEVRRRMSRFCVVSSGKFSY